MAKYNRIVTIIGVAVMSAAALPGADAEHAIRAALAQQAVDWNRGDLPAFTSVYANDCVFVGTTITRGRQATLARYQKRYGTAAERGALTFSNVEVHTVDQQAAFAIGRYHLQRADNTAGGGDGTFTLFWKWDGKQWRIVLDHTTADAPAR